MDDEMDLPFLAFNANDTKFLRKAFTTLSKQHKQKNFLKLSSLHTVDTIQQCICPVIAGDVFSCTNSSPLMVHT